MGLPTEELKAKALELGFQTAGVCDAVPAPHLHEYESWLAKGYHGTMEYLREQLPLKQDPQALLPGCRSIVAVTLNYNQEPPAGGPKIARYALGRDYHKVIRGKLKRLAAWMEATFPGSQCRPCVDSAPIFERDYARLAGLGFFGKNTMLIDPKRGSWFFLGLLLTTVELQPDQPFEGGCGTCTRCIDACPTEALVHEDGRWQLNASRCISYLTIEHGGAIEEELQPGVGDWTFGCDICQEVCPFNQPRGHLAARAKHTEDEDFQSRPWPELTEVAELSYEDWDNLTRGSAIRRAGYEGLKRNARINLQNKRKRGPETGAA